LPATAQNHIDASMHAKALAGESMSEPAKSNASPEIDQLRKALVTAIDESIGALTPGWTFYELRLFVKPNGEVEPSPLLCRKRRPKQH